MHLLLLPGQRPLLEYLVWLLQLGWISSTARDPENSQTPSLRTDTLPEPTADRGIEPAAINELDLPTYQKDWAKHHPGAWASTNVWHGVLVGNTVRHRGDAIRVWGNGGIPRPHSHHRGWADIKFGWMFWEFDCGNFQMSLILACPASMKSPVAPLFPPSSESRVFLDFPPNLPLLPPHSKSASSSAPPLLVPFRTTWKVSQMTKPWAMLYELNARETLLWCYFLVLFKVGLQLSIFFVID